MAPAQSRFDLWIFKKGLMSRLGHDLQISVGGPSFAIEGSLSDEFSVAVTIQTESLSVIGAVKNKELTDALTASDRIDIRRTFLEDILRARDFPKIYFRATGVRIDRKIVNGTLTLCGRSAPLTLHVDVRQELSTLRIQGQTRFLQSDFGIKPYQAFLGALKIQDEIEATWDLTLTHSQDSPQS